MAKLIDETFEELIETEEFKRAIDGKRSNLAKHIASRRYDADSIERILTFKVKGKMKMARLTEIQKVFVRNLRINKTILEEYYYTSAIPVLKIQCAALYACSKYTSTKSAIAEMNRGKGDFPRYAYCKYGYSTVASDIFNRVLLPLLLEFDRGEDFIVAVDNTGDSATALALIDARRKRGENVETEKLLPILENPDWMLMYKIAMHNMYGLRDIVDVSSYVRYTDIFSPRFAKNISFNFMLLEEFDQLESFLRYLHKDYDMMEDPDKYVARMYKVVLESLSERGDTINTINSKAPGYLEIDDLLGKVSIGFKSLIPLGSDEAIRLLMQNSEYVKIDLRHIKMYCDDILEYAYNHYEKDYVYELLTNTYTTDQGKDALSAVLLLQNGIKYPKRKDALLNYLLDAYYLTIRGLDDKYRCVDKKTAEGITEYMLSDTEFDLLVEYIDYTFKNNTSNPIYKTFDTIKELIGVYGVIMEYIIHLQDSIGYSKVCTKIKKLGELTNMYMKESLKCSKHYIVMGIDPNILNIIGSDVELKDYDAFLKRVRKITYDYVLSKTCNDELFARIIDMRLFVHDNYIKTTLSEEELIKRIAQDYEDVKAFNKRNYRDFPVYDKADEAFRKIYTSFKTVYCTHDGLINTEFYMIENRRLIEDYLKRNKVDRETLDLLFD